MKMGIGIGLIAVAVFIAGSISSAWLMSRKTGNQVLGAQQAFSHLTPLQFKAEMGTGQYSLIDVRTAEEYAAGHLKQAKQMDYYQSQKFSDYLDSLDKNGKYLVYCRSGKRSGQALEIMKSKGFINVFDLAGGYTTWVEANLATISGSD